MMVIVPSVAALDVVIKEFVLIDVIMSAIASQITGVSIAYSTVCLSADKNHQSSASLAFVRKINRSTVNTPHNGPIMGKLFPFDDVIMFSVIIILFGDSNVCFHRCVLLLRVIRNTKAYLYIWGDLM